MAETVRAFARFVSGRMLPRIAYPVLRGPLRGAKFILGSLAGEGGGASVYVSAVEKEQTASLVATLRTSCLDHLGSLGYAVERLRLDKDEPTEFLAFRRG